MPTNPHRWSMNEQKSTPVLEINLDKVQSTDKERSNSGERPNLREKVHSIVKSSS
ncbi:MAG: hypothetical protein ACMG6E_09185 [Candidatus Roizmanbacteria bacterium]